MNILITNDDGIDADGLIRLAAAAKKFGSVWVVAPDGQRSAASHSITLRHPIDILPCMDFPVGDVHAFSCSGTPADCVRAGIHAVMPQKPDVVLSGINYGYNAASDIQYSATCGAAFEAAFQGIHAIALSEEACERHEISDRYLLPVLEELISKPLPSGNIHNVNFPGCAHSDFKGILRDRKVSASMFFQDSYPKVEEIVCPDRVQNHCPDNSSEGMEKGPVTGFRCIAEGHPNRACEPGTDMRALVENHISIGIVNNIGY